LPLERFDGESRLLRAAWRLLCLFGDGFEGGLDWCLRLVVVHTLTRGCAHAGSRVLLRGGLWMHKCRRGDVSSALGLHSTGNGSTTLGMVDKTCSMCLGPVAARTSFEGAPMPFRGARCGRRTGVGDTVFWNDIGLSAQCVCSAHTVLGMAA
jgi:hypothetical protein